MKLFKRKEYKFNDYSINRYSALADGHNDDLNVEERRYANQLRVIANGILFMGIWSFIKTFMYILDEARSSFPEEVLQGLAGIIASVIVMSVLFLIVLVIDLFFRFMLWRGAVRESKSDNRKKGYMVCTIILMMYGAYSIGSFFHTLIKDRKVEGDDVIKLIFDVTSFILLWQMLLAAFRLRKIRDDLKTADGAAGSQEIQEITL